VVNKDEQKTRKPLREVAPTTLAILFADLVFLAACYLFTIASLAPSAPSPVSQFHFHF